MIENGGGKIRIFHTLNFKGIDIINGGGNQKYFKYKEYFNIFETFFK